MHKYAGMILGSVGEGPDSRMLREWPPGLEAELQYIHQGHDVLHEEIRDGMPREDAERSLAELNRPMREWQRKYNLNRAAANELVTKMTALGQETLDNAIAVWRREHQFPYEELSHGRVLHKQETYSFADLRYHINVSRAQQLETVVELSELETQPVPKAEDPFDQVQAIPVVRLAAKKSLLQKAQPYLSPFVAACVFLSIPLYKIVAKNPENLDYVVTALMTLPGFTMMRGAYLRQKEFCG